MFLVVFRNRKRAEMDAAAYAADAAHMAALAAVQPGYSAFKSYTAEDGEVVAISEWEDEASARAWGRHAEHAVVQGRGRADYYESYTVFACPEPRVHGFSHEG
ncbi:antibiotic biosynthesis monooxygenase [Novosphingobium sp. 9U]|uniref:antibiotic biosynthesis monooxygenase family protein n=1 Tax=Novosphingobium sp. 9U TaxID=2653158 RepID=UPI0012F1E0EE|nr:antibiotic biosynthesis monooxygenase [Novosphingobium sp. 9U]VWX55000.1 Polysaccharide biosynthesis protein [Novosphingobium sp. 9U]